MALIGGEINPALYPQPDYSGVVQSAQMQSQGLANIGANIGGVIKDFGEAKKERKKLDAGIKATVAGIESAIKMGKSFGIDVESSLSPYLQKINDPNIAPIEAAAYARQASDAINNVLSLGMKANEIGIEQQRSNQAARIKLAEIEAEKRKRGPVTEIAVTGGTQQMQFNPETNAFEPIKVAGQRTSNLSNLPDPLKRYAEDFETAGSKYGVDPKLLAAIAMHETANGTSSAFRNKNNAMGVSNASGPVEMKSVAESIEKMASLLGKGINEGVGPYANAKSIEDIANIYAPQGAENDPNNLNRFWTRGVASNIAKLAENQPEQVETTSPRDQNEFGFTPAKPKTTSRIITGDEAVRLGGDPKKKYIIKESGDEVSEMTVIPPDITPAEERARKEEEGKKIETKRTASAAIKTIDKFIDKDGNFNEDLKKAVGYGEELATFTAQYAPIFQTQSPQDRANQKELSILVEKGLLDAAKELKPISNADLKLLLQNRPAITDPPELWAGFLTNLKSILSDPNSYEETSKESTPSAPLTIEDQLDKVLRGEEIK